MKLQSMMMDDNDERVQDFDDPNVARYIQDKNNDQIKSNQFLF